MMSPDSTTGGLIGKDWCGGESDLIESELLRAVSTPGFFSSGFGVSKIV